MTQCLHNFSGCFSNFNFSGVQAFPYQMKYLQGFMHSASQPNMESFNDRAQEMVTEESEFQI